MNTRVCLIGGGISGTTTAYLLKEKGCDVTLLEKGTCVGGNIKTEIRDGYLLEHGPNSTLVSSELLTLIDQLGISDQIAATNPNSKKRYILRDGKLIALPSKIIGLLGNQAFSTKAKLRLLKEPFVRTKSSDTESVAAFFERRLGKEIVDYAVDPFISGIYAGDPQKLSIKHAFPRLFDLEQNFGSLLIGALFSRSNKASKVPKGTPRSITFRNGMQTLTDALAQSLGGCIRHGASVDLISKSDSGGFIVSTAQGDGHFDSVVICTPSSAAARLVRHLDGGLGDHLDKIYYPPVAVVFTAFKMKGVRIKPDGFGFLAPSLERRKILGSLWTSSVFENRAPEDYYLFTTFIGGARNADLANGTEEEIANIAVEEVASILGIDVDPILLSVKKWEKAIPQYNIGYEKVLGAIDAFKRKNQGIFFCSNFYKGISVSDCIKNSYSTTQDILDFLGRQALSNG